jgi:hypothetical protein
MQLFKSRLFEIFCLSIKNNIWVDKRYWFFMTTSIYKNYNKVHVNYFIIICKCLIQYNKLFIISYLLLLKIINMSYKLIIFIEYLNKNKLFCHIIIYFFILMLIFLFHWICLIKSRVMVFILYGKICSIFSYI